MEKNDQVGMIVQLKVGFQVDNFLFSIEQKFKRVELLKIEY